jgi:hypothetical protein
MLLIFCPNYFTSLFTLYSLQLHAACLFQEHETAVALREKEDLLKKIEIMKEGDIRVHKYYTKEVSMLFLWFDFGDFRHCK